MPFWKFFYPDQKQSLLRQHASFLSSSSLPPGAHQSSQEDLVLVTECQRSVPCLASLQDKTLAEWEDLMRRGLEAVCLADTFIAAMACALRKPLD